MFSLPLFSKILSLLCSLFIFISGGLPALNYGAKRDEQSKARVMSFNLLYGGSLDEKSRSARAPLAAQLIADYMPDSIGVQEANLPWMVQLCSRLPEYDYVGVAREDGNLIGEFSAIFYRKDILKVVDTGTFWLSETPCFPSKGWDAKQMRVCTWAIFENLESGNQYMHINTHFDHVGKNAQVNSASLINKKAAELDLPVVATGDFNVLQGSDVYNLLTSQTLRDSKFLAEDSMDSITFHNFDPTSSRSIIIDFIFVNDKIDTQVYRVVDEKYDDRFVSDHYPLYIDFTFN